MPRNIQRTLGVSPAEVMVNSGGEQFFLFQVGAGPATVGISFAQLPDGTQFLGDATFAGSPAFTTSATNYIWYDLATGSLANNDTGFTGASGLIPLWEITVDGVGAVTNTLDRRSWFGGSGGGGASSSTEKLKEILQHSVMEDAFYDALVTNANIDGVNSTGNFAGESMYELEPGEVLFSNFTVAGADHLAVIDQPYVAVLPDRIIDDVTDIRIDISRVVGGPPAFPSALDWQQAPSNFSLVDLTGQNGTNGFNIRIENTGATTYNIVGWGIYSNPVTAPGGVINPRSGTHLGSTGLDFYNTNPSAYRTAASDFGFSWDSSTDTLSWAAFSGAGDNLQIEINDDAGTAVNELVIPGSIGGISGDNDYVYFDFDRDIPLAPITLQVSSGAPPEMIKDRFILGKRVLSAGLDPFILYGNHTLASQSGSKQYPPPLGSGSEVLFKANSTGFGIGIPTTNVGNFAAPVFNVGSATFDTVSGLYTVPSPGFYRVTGNFQYSGAAFPGGQQISIILTTGATGSASVSNAMTTTGAEPGPGQHVTGLFRFAGAGTIRLQASASGTANLDSELTIEKVRSL